MNQRFLCVVVSGLIAAAMAAPTPAWAQEGVAVRTVSIGGPPGSGGEGGMIVLDGDDLGAMTLDGGPFFGGGGGGGSMSFTAADLEEIARILGFSADQVKASKELFEGYQAELRTKAEEAKKKSDAVRAAARENEDHEEYKKLGPISKALREAREQADKSFEADLKLLATREQAAKWDKVEMYRRRAKLGRGFGGMPGESVDLIRVVQQMKLPSAASAAVAPALDAYERALDSAIVAKNQAQTTARQEMAEALKNRDFAAVGKSQEAVREAGAKIRGVNKAAAAELQALLPEASRVAFELAVRKATYPQIYRERYVDKALAAAADFKDLTTEQGRSLGALRREYAQAAEAINRRAEEATDKAGASGGAMPMVFGGGDGASGAVSISTVAIGEGDAKGGGGGGGRVERREDPMAPIRKERRELEERTLKALESVLTPEQMAALPPRPGTVEGKTVKVGE
ncbi:MAG: hypothetical protein ACREJO_12100 [Phycisphaerales bacterium]